MFVDEGMLQHALGCKPLAQGEGVGMRPLFVLCVFFSCT